MCSDDVRILLNLAELNAPDMIYAICFAVTAPIVSNSEATITARSS